MAEKSATKTADKIEHKNLNEALLAVQLELENPKKNQTNPHLKKQYADLPSIRDQVTPILAKHGLFVTHLNMYDAPSAQALVRTVIIFAATGEFIESIAPLILEKPTPQGFGIAMTYQRRYQLMAALNIIGEDEDDDGESLETRNKKAVATQPKQAAQPVQRAPMAQAVVPPAPQQVPEWAIRAQQGYGMLVAAEKQKNLRAFNNVWLDYQVDFNKLRQEAPVEYQKIYELYASMNKESE